MGTLKMVKVQANFDERYLFAKCPFCGAEIRCGFDEDGNLKWWENEGEPCPHFRGLYGGSSIDTISAVFEA